MSSNSAKELARIAAVSNHPIKVLPPEPIQTKLPGHRRMAKGTPRKFLFQNHRKMCSPLNPRRTNNFRKYGIQMPMKEIFGANEAKPEQRGVAPLATPTPLSPPPDYSIPHPNDLPITTAWRKSWYPREVEP